MVKGRDASHASSSGQRPANVQAVLQQTCKLAASKRASKLPAAASGSRAAAATVDKPRQQNRADLAFGPEVNGFTSLRSQIPGFVVDGPIWHCCASSWTYGAFNSYKNLFMIGHASFNFYTDFVCSKCKEIMR